MIEVTCNDRLGKKVRVKCNPDDTIGDLKKLISAQTGTHWEKIVLKKWYTIFKDHIKLADCILSLASFYSVSQCLVSINSVSLTRYPDEIRDGMNLELYYQ